MRSRGQDEFSSVCQLLQRLLWGTDGAAQLGNKPVLQSCDKNKNKIKIKHQINYAHMFLYLQEQQTKIQNTQYLQNHR